MGARERDWIMVRIRRHVHQQIRDLGERWEREAERLPRQVPTQGDSRWSQVSVSDLVEELLRRSAAHRERAKNSSRKRSARARAAKAGRVPPSTDNAPLQS